MNLGASLRCVLLGMAVMLCVASFGSASLTPAQSAAVKLAHGPEQARGITDANLNAVFDPGSQRTGALPQIKSPAEWSALAVQWQAKGNGPDLSSSNIDFTATDQSPWHGSAFQTPGFIVFAATIPGQTPTPCFGSVGVEEQVTIWAPGLGEMPIVATPSRLLLGYPAMDCQVWVETIEKTVNEGSSGEQMTPGSDQEVLFRLSLVAEPALEVQFTEHTAAKEWAAALRRPPAIGVADASKGTFYVLLRDQDAPSRVLVVPLKAARGADRPSLATQLTGKGVPSWVAAKSSGDKGWMNSFVLDGEPWILPR